MSDQLKKRTACDRCHSQKLRCLRRPDGHGCIRCFKAKASCVFSPSARALRSNLSTDLNEITEHQAMEATCPEEELFLPHRNEDIYNQNFDNSVYFDQDVYIQDAVLVNDLGSPSFDSMHVDWTTNSFPSFDATESHAQASIDQHQQHPTQCSAPDVSNSTSNRAANVVVPQNEQYDQVIPPSATTVSSTPAALCLAEIGQLSRKLYAHSLTIPNMSYDSFDPNTPQAGESETIMPLNHHMKFITPELAEERQHVLDRTLEYTQSMIDLYPRFIGNILHLSGNIPRYHPGPSQDIPNSRHGKLNYSRPDPADQPQPLVLDHSSILLILSCHIRLISCWDDILGQMKICMDHALIPGNFAVSRYVPDVLVGSFKPSESQVVPMQLILLMHLLSQLWENTGKLVSAIQSSTSTTAGENQTHDPLSKIVITMSLDVQRRSKANLDELKRLRRILIDEELIYGLDD